jgi:beta-glucanase (GH16 family)
MNSSYFTIYIAHIVFLIASSIPVSVLSQQCDGAEIFTRESYLYGRFEVAMQSAPGSGIVSSFFLFNNQSGCNYPEENNEIDIEMTGNKNDIYFTTHHPGSQNPWFYGDNFDLGFNPHQDIHHYAIEWEPGIVRWFVDNALIYVQDEEAANDLMYPMAIYMNLWASEVEDWVGPWNPAILPRHSKYEYVKYYQYRPGSGNYGINNNYRLEWEDHFEFLDTERWTTSDFTQFALNYCTYKTGNVSINDGYLYLLIAEHLTSTTQIPVTFSVNVADLDLDSSDKIYLNGTFNNWCGTCNPMTQMGDMWELTLNLIPGRYEYLYVLNLWETTGGAPLNSECDFTPCDEFLNYGFILQEAVDHQILDTYCWSTCDNCQTTGVEELSLNSDKKLIKIIDVTGREVLPSLNKLLFYLYNDGSYKKRFIVKH